MTTWGDPVQLGSDVKPPYMLVCELVECCMFYIDTNMVKRCVAAWCSNTYSNNVSLFSFPKDPQLRNLWTKQVKRTRDKWMGPTEHSVLCSDHFTPDCFETTPGLMATLGISHRRSKVLKDTAVPTVFPRPGPHSKTANGSSSVSKTPRTAYAKRSRIQVIYALHTKIIFSPILKQCLKFSEIFIIKVLSELNISIDICHTISHVF